MKKLSVVTTVVDDFAGCAFTCVNIANQLGQRVREVDFVVVDNRPGSGESRDVRKLCEHQLTGGHYISFGPRTGTFAAKQAGLQAADTEFVLVLDSHVLLQDGAILRLLDFCRDIGSDNHDLFHGPLCNSAWKIYATHMNPLVSSQNFGRWGTYRDDTQQRRVIDNCNYYQVPANGMGLFFCRRDSWPGFHPALRGFGSEEGYIHAKYRLLGRSCWNIPYLKWWHLFRDESRNIKYSLSNEDKYRNFLISWSETGLPLDIIHQAFGFIPEEKRRSLLAEVESLAIRRMEPVSDTYDPFLGYPLRVQVGGEDGSSDYTAFEKPIFAT